MNDIPESTAQVPAASDEQLQKHRRAVRNTAVLANYITLITGVIGRLTSTGALAGTVDVTEVVGTKISKHIED